MFAAPAPALGSPGIDRFSPAQLLRTARLFASDPALPPMVEPDSGEPVWVRLDSNPYLQIWLLSWPAGTHNGWHDHGESAGAFQIVSGALLEQTSPEHGQRTFGPGQGRSFGQHHIHHLANVGLHAALSVHVYAPRLTSLTRYEITPTGLQPKAVNGCGLNRS